MLAWVRRQLSPATVMAFVALVFATTGGAFAVTGRGGPGPAASAGSASAVANVAKSKAKPKGKPGPRGPAGPAGAQGPAGPAGATGPQGAAGPAGAAGVKGENGAAGTNGTNGTNGTSVTSVESKSKIGSCEEGGSAFTSASGKTYACKGKEGSPWTAGGTLPVGATETGTWYVSAPKRSVHFSAEVMVASFPIELAAPLDAEHVHYINENKEEVTGVTFTGGEPTGEVTAPQTACPGSVEEPKAVSGNLCIYTSTDGRFGAFGFSQGISSPSRGSGAGRTGAILTVLDTETEAASSSAEGTWAVTG